MSDVDYAFPDWPETISRCSMQCFVDEFEKGNLPCPDLNSTACLCIEEAKNPIRSAIRICHVGKCPEFGLTPAGMFKSHQALSYRLLLYTGRTKGRTWLTTTGVGSAFWTFLNNLCDAFEKNEASASSALADTTTSSAVDGTATTSDSETSTHRPTYADDTSDSDASGGLSPGAKGGIAAEVIVAVLLLIVGFLLGRRYLRRRHADPAAVTEPETGNKLRFPELDGNVGNTKIMSSTQSDPHIAELDSGPPRSGHPARLSELDGRRAPGELPTIEPIPMLGDTPAIGFLGVSARG